MQLSESLKKYFTDIQSPHYYYGRSVINLALHNSARHINFFRRRGPSKHLLENTKLLKNVCSEKTALILGNGPSLNKIDYAFIENEINDIFVVNDFYMTDAANHIVPTFYVFSDPASFFNTHDGHRHSKDNLLQYLNKISPTLILSHFARKSFFVNSFNTLFFDDREWNFFSRNTSPLKPRCYTSITSLKALAFASFMGYKHIYILGFDNTEFIGYRSDINNKLWLETKSTYSSKRNEENKFLDMSGFVSGLAGRLQSYSHAYGDLKRFNRKIVFNLDPESLITNFEKKLNGLDKH